jgi:hypothetical protein
MAILAQLFFKTLIFFKIEFNDPLRSLEGLAVVFHMPTIPTEFHIIGYALRMQFNESLGICPCLFEFVQPVEDNCDSVHGLYLVRVNLLES